MSIDLRLGDCLEIMRDMPANSVDLIATDPPYYKVKGEDWDRQWDTPQKFLEWLDLCAAQWQRILKPNGSLYCFASPRMAARVEVMLGARFNVLNHITWRKEEDRGKHAAACKETLRGYFPNTERIIFCEHHNAGSYAKGEAGYAAKCDELRGFIFEPLRKYLDDERKRAGVSYKDLARFVGVTPTMLGQHYFSSSQWAMPTPKAYEKMRQGLTSLNHGGAYLTREYEDLRREYEDLRREYEDLRRPFQVSADVPYTDVWTFPTVAHYAGKHPCEKPAAMMEHIITASSRVGATVLDCFMGSGATIKAAAKLGRNAIGIEINPQYFEIAQRRIAEAQAQMTLNFAEATA